MVNVLIVDDSTTLTESWRGSLPFYLREDFQVPVSVRTANSAEEAEHYIQWAEIAFVDKNLDTGHRRGGFALIDRIKAENPSAYVVLFSGEVREYAARECKFDEFVDKTAGMEKTYRIIASFHRRQTQPSQDSTVRTPLDRYLEGLREGYGFDFELKKNCPNSEVTDEFWRELAEELGEGNFEFGDAFDENGNLIPDDKDLRGIYVRRGENISKPKEDGET